MKDKVVCIDGGWFQIAGAPGKPIHPRKGEIYTVSAVRNYAAQDYYYLVEFPEGLYSAASFRPVDDTFGPLICEIIEQETELEKVISI